MNKKRKALRKILLHSKCHYCDAKASSLDHNIPQSLGGPYARWNIVPACISCNNGKSNRMPTCKCNQCKTAVQMYEFKRLSQLFS